MFFCWMEFFIFFRAFWGDARWVSCTQKYSNCITIFIKNFEIGMMKEKYVKMQIKKKIYVEFFWVDFKNNWQFWSFVNYDTLRTTFPIPPPFCYKTSIAKKFMNCHKFFNHFLPLKALRYLWPTPNATNLLYLKISLNSYFKIKFLNKNLWRIHNLISFIKNFQTISPKFHIFPILINNTTFIFLAQIFISKTNYMNHSQWKH